LLSFCFLLKTNDLKAGKSQAPIEGVRLAIFLKKMILKKIIKIQKFVRFLNFAFQNFFKKILKNCAFSANSNLCEPLPRLYAQARAPPPS
jgi:hypothetical protein